VNQPQWSLHLPAIRFEREGGGVGTKVLSLDECAEWENLVKKIRGACLNTLKKGNLGSDNRKEEHWKEFRSSEGERNSYNSGKGTKKPNYNYQTVTTTWSQ